MWSRSYCVVFCLVLSFACALASAQTRDRPRGAPPRSDAAEADPNDSSSRQTKVDMSPPAGEAPLDLKSDVASDRQEVKPWDPHKADHNVEVGDQYFQKKNYQAAISRYREALYWKDDDAVASFRLARALEVVGQYSEARKYYQQYLKILPKAEFSAECLKSIERLKDKVDAPQKAALPVPKEPAPPGPR